jgi:anaerobic magnesium-protoporphyrin IX monomethyl ester cyclase
VETASPRLQKRTKKNLDLEKVWDNIELMAQLRIFTRGFFMLGYPTETEEELQATIEYAAKSRLHLASFHITNPFPGTAIFEEFKALGKLPEGVNSIDYEYVGAPFNGSEVSDARFRALFRQAYTRFYFRPWRIVRILRDRPYNSGYSDGLLSLITKFAGFRRIREALRS